MDFFVFKNDLVMDDCCDVFIFGSSVFVDYELVRELGYKCCFVMCSECFCECCFVCIFRVSDYNVNHVVNFDVKD